MADSVPPCSKPAMNRRRVILADVLAVLISVTIGICLVLYPYATGRKMPGDLVDGRFNASVLEFFYRTLASALRGEAANFTNAPFFYPWPRVANFSDTFWGDGEIYALFRAVGINPIASFRAWFIAGFALTYGATFASLRVLGLRTQGALAGAFLFTFPLPMAAQLGHAQLVYRLWVPPALVAFDRFLTRKTLRDGATCILFLALELAASIYLGLFLCLLLASYMLAVYLVDRDRLALRRWSALRSSGLGELITSAVLIAASLTILAIVGVPYFDTASMYGFIRPWTEVAAMLPRPGSYLLAGPSKIWPNLSATLGYPFAWEHQMFPGLSAIIPLVWFAISRQARARQPFAAPMIVCAITLIVITLDFNGYTMYPLIYLLPGFSAIRTVTRIILIIMLPLAILFGILIDDLVTTGVHRAVRSCVAVALSVFLVTECAYIGHNYSSLPTVWHTRLAALEARLPRPLPAHAIIAIRTRSVQAGIDWPLAVQLTDADFAAAMLGIRTMNGYSGNRPPRWKTLTSCRDVGEDLRAGRHFRIEHDLPTLEITPRQLVLVGFGDCEPISSSRDPILRFNHRYKFGEGREGNQFTADGFSDPQEWGRRINAKKAFLFFRLLDAPQGPVSVVIKLHMDAAATDRNDVVTVVANGQRCGRLLIGADQSQDAIICPRGTLRAGNNALQLLVADPSRLIDTGVLNGKRLFGLGIQTLTLTTLSDSSQ